MNSVASAVLCWMVGGCWCMVDCRTDDVWGIMDDGRSIVVNDWCMVSLYTGMTVVGECGVYLIMCGGWFRIVDARYMYDDVWCGFACWMFGEWWSAIYNGDRFLWCMFDGEGYMKLSVLCVNDEQLMTKDRLCVVNYVRRLVFGV